jgi:hypothetical protein
MIGGMPSPVDQTGALSECAQEQSRSTLDQQRHALESLRNRSGTLLTGATISTSFLGGQALAHGSLGLLSWLAIVCFVVVSLASLAILWPRQEAELMTDRPSPEPLIAAARDDTAGRQLALLRHRCLSVERNEAYLAQIATYLRIGVTFLLFEVLWWVADLATSA